MAESLRNAIAERYGCGGDRIVCFDGHTGLLMSAKENHKGNWKITAGVGNRVVIRVFAKQACAPDRLAHLSTESKNVLVSDSLTKPPTPAGKATDGKAAKVAEGAKQVSDILGRADKALAQAEGSTTKIQEFTWSMKRFLREARDRLPSTIPPNDRAAVAAQLEEARTEVERLEGAARAGDAVAGARDQVRAARAQAESLKVESQKEDKASAWGAIQVENEPISVWESAFTVPSDETVRFFNITLKNISASGQPIWPEQTVEVAVLHGKYYIDFGLLMAAVIDGKQEFSVAGGNIKRDEGTTIQPYASINWYPAGRRKGQWLGGWGTFGLQAGILASAPADGFAIGGIIEPVNGLAISGGVSLIKRDKLKPGYKVDDAAPGGEVPLTSERVPRAYLGLTIGYELFNTAAKAGKSQSE